MRLDGVIFSPGFTTLLSVDMATNPLVRFPGHDWLESWQSSRNNEVNLKNKWNDLVETSNDWPIDTD